jgi:hypothetical protein
MYGCLFGAGFFSLKQPFPPVRNWVWQAAAPSYAQAVTSLYADVLFGGKLLSFRVGAGARPVIIRKHRTKPVYVIALATERNSNVKNNCQAAANVTVRVGNTTDAALWPGAADTAAWNITLNARLQGSVYLIDRTSAAKSKVVQLDGWHDHRHFYFWPKHVTIEAELVDLMQPPAPGPASIEQEQSPRSLDRVLTEQTVASAAGAAAFNDYAAFISYVALAADSPPLSFEAELPIPGAPSNQHTDQAAILISVDVRMRRPVGFGNLSIALWLGEGDTHHREDRVSVVPAATAANEWQWVRAVMPMTCGGDCAHTGSHHYALRVEIAAANDGNGDGDSDVIEVDKITLSA